MMGWESVGVDGKRSNAMLCIALHHRMQSCRPVPMVCHSSRSCWCPPPHQRAGIADMVRPAVSSFGLISRCSGGRCGWLGGTDADTDADRSLEDLLGRSTTPHGLLKTDSCEDRTMNGTWELETVRFLHYLVSNVSRALATELNQAPLLVPNTESKEGAPRHRDSKSIA